MRFSRKQEIIFDNIKKTSRKYVFSWNSNLKNAPNVFKRQYFEVNFKFWRDKSDGLEIQCKRISRFYCILMHLSEKPYILMHLAENSIEIHLKFDSELSNGQNVVPTVIAAHEKVFRSLAKKKNGHCLGAIIC